MKRTKAKMLLTGRMLWGVGAHASDTGTWGFAETQDRRLEASLGYMSLCFKIRQETNNCCPLTHFPTASPRRRATCLGAMRKTEFESSPDSQGLGKAVCAIHPHRR